MADPLSLCASIIAVATLGAQLSTSLYRYSETIYSAESRLSLVAQDVSLTSSVISELGKVLDAEKDVRICSNTALNSAQQAVESCEKIFKDIDGSLQSSLRKESSIKTLSTYGKLKWPMTQKKMDYLRTSLDRLKSSLTLLMSVAVYARQLSTEQNRDTASLEIQKVQIQGILELNRRNKNSLILNSGRVSLEAIDRELESEADEIGACFYPTVELRKETSAPVVHLESKDRTVEQSSFSPPETTSPAQLMQCLNHMWLLTSLLQVTYLATQTRRSLPRSTVIDRWSYAKLRSTLDPILLGDFPEKLLPVDLERQDNFAVLEELQNEKYLERLSSYMTSIGYNANDADKIMAIERTRKRSWSEYLLNVLGVTSIQKYPMIQRDHVALETLRFYDLPWKYCEGDGDFIVILQEMTDSETEALFRHTSKLRAKGKGTILQIEDIGKSNKPQYMMVRRRSKTKRGKSHPSGADRLAESVLRGYGSWTDEADDARLPYTGPNDQESEWTDSDWGSDSHSSEGAAKAGEYLKRRRPESAGLQFVNITHPDQTKTKGPLKTVRQQAMNSHLFQDSSPDLEEGRRVSSRETPIPEPRIQRAASLPNETRLKQLLAPSADVRQLRRVSSLNIFSRPSPAKQSLDLSVEQLSSQQSNSASNFIVDYSRPYRPRRNYDEHKKYGFLDDELVNDRFVNKEHDENGTIAETVEELLSRLTLLNVQSLGFEDDESAQDPNTRLRLRPEALSRSARSQE